MLVTRTSILSGKTITLDIPGLTLDMIRKWENGAMIQDAMPNIPPELREFVSTGIAPDEWAERLPPEPDEDEDEDEEAWNARLNEMQEDGMDGSCAFTALIMAGPNPSDEEADYWDSWKEEMKMRD